MNYWEEDKIKAKSVGDDEFSFITVKFLQISLSLFDDKNHAWFVDEKTSRIWHSFLEGYKIYP